MFGLIHEMQFGEVYDNDVLCFFLTLGADTKDSFALSALAPRNLSYLHTSQRWNTSPSEETKAKPLFN